MREASTGYVTVYACDSLGRLANVVTGSGTADAITNSFTYSGAGDRLTLRDGRGNVTTWAYDSYGRVTSKRDANNTEILRYLYDPNGHGKGSVLHMATFVLRGHEALVSQQSETGTNSCPVAHAENGLLLVPISRADSREQYATPGLPV